MSVIDGSMIKLLERMLDVSTKRESAISSNIANIDTPGYQTKDVDFEEAMKAADGMLQKRGLGLETTEQGHLGGSNDASLAQFEFEPSGLTRRNDLNNVSIDREMLALATTAGRYGAAIELIRKRFALIKYAVMDGRSG